MATGDYANLSHYDEVLKTFYLEGIQEYLNHATILSDLIEVNEKGTEAAAATGVVIAKAIHIEPVFRANHPFIFIIKDNRSGSILFMRRVMNPDG